MRRGLLLNVITSIEARVILFCVEVEARIISFCTTVGGSEKFEPGTWPRAGFLGQSFFEQFFNKKILWAFRGLLCFLEGGQKF